MNKNHFSLQRLLGTFLVPLIFTASYAPNACRGSCKVSDCCLILTKLECVIKF
jgi:hypothetical protein